MTTSEAISKTDHALALAEHGYGIFPAWGPKGGVCACPRGAECTSPAKHPVTANGFKDATTDPTKIRTFLSGNNNYGVVPKDGVFVLDVDGPDVERLERLADDYGPLPATFTVSTRNGKHVYYRWPDAVPRPTHKMLGLITRWGGGRGQGYVIGPGSVHSSGYVYTLSGAPDVAEFPDRWVQAAGVKPVEFHIPGGPDELPGKGGRHDWLRDKARHYAGIIRDPEVLLAAVLAENARLDEPKTEAEVKQAIGDVLEKYEADPEAAYVEAAHFGPRGLGWGMRDLFNDHTVDLEAQELHERRGEVRATITVTLDGEERTRTIEPLVSAVATARLAEALVVTTGKLGIHWPSILTGFYRRVLDEWERPEELANIGLAPIQDPAYVVRPVLVKDVPTILFAKEGTGKSTLAAGLAVSVATGLPLLEGWDVENPCPVLVLDWETSQEDWNAHIAYISMGLGVAPPDNIYYRHMAQPITKDIKQTAKMITDKGIGLVVVDSTMMAGPSGGSEAAEGALELFRALRMLNTTTLLVDHLNKQTASGDGARPYGSVYKPALARATFELWEGDPPATVEEDTQYLVLSHRKANLTARHPDTNISLGRSILGIRFDTYAAYAPITAQVEAAIAVLEKHGPMTGAKIAERTGNKRSTFEHDLAQHPRVLLTAGEFSLREVVDDD
jgi:hypothetical protein